MFKAPPTEEIPFNRALLWILLSVLMIPGSVFMGWLYYQHAKEKRVHDEQYRIVAIVQSSPQQEGLKTGYLAELLDLSIDHPVNLYLFNAKEGERKLLACPLIKSARIQKILPGTLYIHYEMRTPIAYLGDYSNTAIDAEGCLFPFRPFFTPKKLPTLYLGLKELEGKWGSCLVEQERLKLAIHLLKQLERKKNPGLAIKQIDVADAFADSDGQRQIIIALEEQQDFLLNESAGSILLRLNTEHYQQNLANFFSLQDVLSQQKKKGAENKKESQPVPQSIIIDLRIPHLAFIK